MKLTPFEELVRGSGDAKEVELRLIDDFPNHPFRVTMDADMEQLIGSIRESGVLTPVILRKKTDGNYEAISGHRRCFACRYLHMETIPAVVREISDEDAVIWMVNSNIQRTNILPSEKAKAYQMKMAALAKQGKRTDLAAPETSRQLVGKWNRETVERIGEEAGDSGRQVQRFLRLNHLIPELLEWVDGGKLSFTVGVELSYLQPEQQKLLLQYLEANPARISTGLAKKLREIPWDVPLSDEQLREIFGRETQKPRKRQKEQADRMSGDDLRKYFPKDYTAAQRRETMIRLLKKWKEGGYTL
ncbi:MAG: ParB/RepB/Spo0J family partition protein [Lachnospiraceae bacterium]|nr:ParB/RepB/Spo0J family partition protein [Lachnospiraceae bacterium]